MWKWNFSKWNYSVQHFCRVRMSWHLHGGAALLSLLVIPSCAIDPVTGVSKGTALTKGKIQVVTPNLDIVPNRMVFSTVNRQERASKTLSISNTGSGPLTITNLSLGNSQQDAVRVEDQQRGADFKLVNAPARPFILDPNQSLNLSIKFMPQRVSSLNRNSPTHTLNGENYALLTITSDDPDQPRTKVDLAGLNSANYEGNKEVSVAEIARTFGWTFDVGTEDNIMGGSKNLLGDEVYSPYWLSANATKPVLLWPLAVFSGRTATPHNSIRFEPKPGSGVSGGLIYEFAGRADDDLPAPTDASPGLGNKVPGSNNISGGENQKLLPKILVNRINSTPTRNTVDFTPTTAFALNRGGSWTDDSQNPNGSHNWRIFPVKDSQGNPIANTWFATVDPVYIAGQQNNFDYNDVVYLLVNAKPEFPQP